MSTKRRRHALSRDEWLEKALVAVTRAGGARLRVESLVAAVGVSKGSFYWHFKSRDQFIAELIDYWHDRYTLSVARHFDAADVTEAEKLRQLMEMVYVDRLTRHDLAFRSWAIAEPKLRRLVKRTDMFRLDYLNRLFEGIGFDKDAADLRSRAFLAIAAWEATLFERMTRVKRVRRARALYNFLITDETPGFV